MKELAYIRFSGLSTEQANKVLAAKDNQYQFKVSKKDGDDLIVCDATMTCLANDGKSVAIEFAELRLVETPKPDPIKHYPADGVRPEMVIRIEGILMLVLEANTNEEGFCSYKVVSNRNPVPAFTKQYRRTELIEVVNKPESEFIKAMNKAVETQTVRDTIERLVSIYEVPFEPIYAADIQHDWMLVFDVGTAPEYVVKFTKEFGVVSLTTMNKEGALNERKLPFESRLFMGRFPCVDKNPYRMKVVGLVGDFQYMGFTSKMVRLCDVRAGQVIIHNNRIKNVAEHKVYARTTYMKYRSASAKTIQNEHNSPNDIVELIIPSDEFQTGFVMSNIKVHNLLLGDLVCHEGKICRVQKMATTPSQTHLRATDVLGNTVISGWLPNGTEFIRIWKRKSKAGEGYPVKVEEKKSPTKKPENIVKVELDTSLFSAKERMEAMALSKTTHQFVRADLEELEKIIPEEFKDAMNKRLNTLKDILVQFGSIQGTSLESELSPKLWEIWNKTVAEMTLK